MKKKIVSILLLCTLLLTSCSPADKKAEKTAPEQKDLKKLTLVLDYTPNTNHTGIYVAKEKGYFAEEGIELSIQQPPVDGAASLVASGKAQFGIDYQDTIASSYAQKNPLPVTNIAALVQHNTSGIISLKGKGIDKPKGLEGKKYATWGLDIEQSIIKNVVEKDGGDFSKVQLIPSSTSDVFTALNGEVDAVWIFYGWDGIAAKLKKVDVDYFAFKDINPVFDYYTPTIIANNEFLKQDAETTKAFLRAVKKGYEFSIENPEAAADILVKSNPELDRNLIVESQKYLNNEYISDAKKWGYIDSNRWNTFYEWLFENKLIEQSIPKDFGFTNDYLPE